MDHGAVDPDLAADQCPPRYITHEALMQKKSCFDSTSSVMVDKGASNAHVQGISFLALGKYLHGNLL